MVIGTYHTNSVFISDHFHNVHPTDYENSLSRYTYIEKERVGLQLHEVTEANDTA